MKFTIEPDALSGVEASDIRNLYKSWWGPYGILVFPVRILKHLKCKPSIKDMLQSLYTQFRSQGYPIWQKSNHIDWASIQRPVDLAMYHPQFELALIEETRALAERHATAQQRIPEL